MQWDVFCRVVDNYGDVGFGWRLAADLAARGIEVRFWLDDQRALAWMAPAGAPGVRVGTWPEAGATAAPGDVVVETFGCGLPEAFADAMVARPAAPVWIDVEYLSAESVVERNHGLPSPRPEGPGAGLTQWFFYPGFTESSGGLLREPGLGERRRRFSPSAWFRSVIDDAQLPREGERILSLFCYDNPVLPALLDSAADQPTLLLATAGRAARQVSSALGPALRRGALRAVLLRRLSQIDYDHLLWASDLNFVRGEDSLVRAVWAGAPFVWQIYPQHDDAHVRKLEAFLDRFLARAPSGLAATTRGTFLGWNGLAKWPGLPHLDDWRAHCEAWCTELRIQSDLGTRLVRFAAAKMLK